MGEKLLLSPRLILLQKHLSLIQLIKPASKPLILLRLFSFLVYIAFFSEPGRAYAVEY